MEASTTVVNFTGTLTQSGTALQPVLVSGTNIKTINSTSILGSGNIAVVTSPSGVSGAIQFSDGSAFASDATNLFWDDTNNRLGIGLNNPSARVDIKGVGTTSATTALSVANSAGTQLLQVRDDGTTIAQNFTGTGYFSLTSEQRLVIGTAPNRTLLRPTGDGILCILNAAEADFNRLQFGGTSSAYPSIKRNGTAIDFRLADDSGFTNISANNANLGSATTGSRLSVRGDGTNSIARFENPFGTISFGINSLGDTFNFGSGGNVMYVVNQNGSSTINGKALAWYANIDTSAGFCFSFNDNNTQSYTTGTGGMLAIANAIFSPGSGSANFRPTSIQYTINASGAQTGTATGIFLNATETALNGLTHNLMDLQVGGSSKFNVNNVGAISIGNTVASAVAVASTHKVTVVIGGTTYYLLATNI
jgi:hypothetical protein